MEHLSGPLIVMAVFAWLAVDSYVSSRAETAKLQVKLEAQKMEFEAQKLFLEKCRDTEEVRQFLATDAGKRFLERMNGMVEGPEEGKNPLFGILALTITGAVGMALGVAFFILSKFTEYSVLIIPAFLVAIPGVGLLIGAAATYHLKKKWGLLRGEPAVRTV